MSRSSKCKSEWYTEQVPLLHVGDGRWQAEDYIWSAIYMAWRGGGCGQPESRVQGAANGEGKWKFWITKFILGIGKGKDGRGSSVGIANDYGLDGPESNPGGGRDFPPVQTGPGTHPASCIMGTGSFPGIEAAGGWGWPPPPSSAEGPRKE